MVVKALFPLYILTCIAEREIKREEQREIMYLDMRGKNKQLNIFNTQMRAYLWKYVVAADHQNEAF